MQYENKVGAKFDCPYCEESKKGKPKKPQDFRLHVQAKHKEIPAAQYERYLVQCRYPTLDIDALVARYVDRLETMIGLQYQGLFIKKYLKTIGVARHPQADKGLMGILAKNPGIKTAEDVRKAFENSLIGKFREASPIDRFKGYLNRDIAILENKGQSDLIEPIKALKTIKFIKQQLEAAREAAKPAEPEQSDEAAEETT